MLVWICICRFPLPLGAWEGLRVVIVAFPGLFSNLFYFFLFYFFFFLKKPIVIVNGNLRTHSPIMDSAYSRLQIHFIRGNWVMLHSL